jgi:N-acetyl-anhydromuramyl-L-alanine amidase AmpD
VTETSAEHMVEPIAEPSAMRVAEPALGAPFLAFFEHYGRALCGDPIGGVVVEEGRRRQYFQCLALEEHEPGRVRVLRLGEAWRAIHAMRAVEEVVAAPATLDVSRQMRRDPAQRYPSRPLCDIRYLVLHHTGAPPGVGPDAIAAEHVDVNGWPGIGYHYVIDLAGTVYRTQDLTVASYHARQFNPASVGIALVGDLTSSQPTPAQLDATAGLLADLLFDLGLPPDAVRGHREMVPTSCPGEAFLRVWKPRLMQAVNDRANARAVERARRLAADASPAR